MERLLVTGVDYPVGANLALKLADRCDVLGLYHRHAVECSDFATAHWDARDGDALDRLIHGWQPQWVIHCSALSASSWDALDRAAPADEEPGAVERLVEVSRAAAARLTVISSDVMFAGPRMFHDENAPANSPSPRAIPVRAMERVAEQAGALVVRTHAYGWSPVPAHAGFAELAFESLAAGILPSADGRRHATPVLATDLAELLWRAYELRAQGLYHLAGAERTSCCGFVSQLAAACGLSEPLSRQEAPRQPLAWHDETSLNSRRARRLLEMATPLLREGLNQFAEQAERGWRDRWRAADRSARGHKVAA